ncbi:unnamed protein product [Lymnaea stagnalis]|uniref:EF-hand domain-containing protein n=1 Tax=Lymnaea stagnalis TaxID=6523 RepID=A0AAV2I732_LYMST
MDGHAHVLLTQFDEDGPLPGVGCSESSKESSSYRGSGSGLLVSNNSERACRVGDGNGDEGAATRGDIASRESPNNKAFRDFRSPEEEECTRDLSSAEEEQCTRDKEEDDFENGFSDDDVRDSDYDTDLEMDDDKWLYPEKYDHDITGHRKYLHVCRELGIKPVRYFLEHIQDVRLSLRHHGLGPEAMKAMAPPLQMNTTIEHMDLEGNWILGEGANYLCWALRENVFITHLNLSENKMENEGASFVCKLLLANKTIERLELAGNEIGDQVGEMFFQLLTKSNSNLRHLNLRHNKLEDGAAQWFKDALTDNDTLEYLDLSWNNFQVKGCVLLAEGLKENVGLKEMAVAMNGFGLEGGKALGEAIKANRTLLRLDASYCRLPGECASVLAHGLIHSDHLSMLDVSYNCLGATGAFELLKGIEKNEASNMALLNLGNTHVDVKFRDLQEKLKEERKLEVYHGGVLEDYKVEALVKVEVDPMEAFTRDPFTKLKEWVEKAGYRLIDLLRHFDKDQSMTISPEELRHGIAATNIPITHDQLQILVDRLDKDGDGEIDFRELIEEDRKHRKEKRDLKKLHDEQD